MTEFMLLVTNLFEVSLTFVLMILFVALLIYVVRGLHHAILFLFSLGAGTVIVYLFKLFFNVPRPLGGVVFESTSSFPSYHAAISVIFFIMLMYIFDSKLKSFGRILFNLFCIVSIFAVSLSRVYLGVHWLSDVLVGIVLGSIVSYVCIKTFNLYRK